MAQIINLDNTDAPSPSIRKIEDAVLGDRMTGSIALVARDWHRFLPYMKTHSGYKMCTSTIETGPDVYVYWGEYSRRKLFTDEFYDYTDLGQQGWGMKSIGLIAKGPGDIIGALNKTAGAVVKGIEGLKDLGEKGADVISDLRDKKFSCATPTERGKNSMKGSSYSRGDVTKKVLSDILHAINASNRFFVAITTNPPGSPVLHKEKSKRIIMVVEPVTSFTFGDLLPYF